MGTTNSQLAEDFADFFLNKIDRIREEFTNIPAYQPKQLDTPKLKKFTPVTQSQLAKIIKAMPTNTCQLDVIPTDKLKQVLEGCLPALTHIINKLLDTNQFCSEWKEALVKPLIQQPMVSQEKSNYRLVSNLGFISKIVEKVTLIQFTKHCDENSLLPTYQSAYRRNHSCETSLVKLVDDLLWATVEQLVTAVVILDLSAAFDMVDHNLLLEVLEMKFGVTDNAKQWYHNYIKSRKFRVIIGKNKSEPRQLDYSVPQGSIQGVLIFSNGHLLCLHT